jgi:hypothetical protein
MRKALPFLAILSIWYSCNTINDEISFDSGLQIKFSNDSVAFDTLLSNRRSATQRLTVYNPNKNAILLSEILLGKGTASDYSIIVNGKVGSQIDERILGEDSLLILVEVNIDPQNRNTPYLVKDSIIFNWNDNSEHVKLVSWGQDGQSVSNQVICNTTWTRDRPYIISDTVLVSSNCTLTIERGTTIFMENDAAIFIQGSLQAAGDSANHIVIRNARFDGIYDQTPGQWNGIYFLEGSQNNQIAFTDIFNGQIGLRIGSPDDDDIPDVMVNNSTISNMSFAGILAFTSDIEVNNTLIYNCGSYLAGNFAGGNYTYRHCTFSNDASFFVHDQPGVQFSDNVVIGEDQLLVADLNLEISNSIIWGSGSEEFDVNDAGGASVNSLLNSNIIRSTLTYENNFTSTQPNFPGFTNSFVFDYSLDTLSFAKDKAVDIGIEIDITGAERDEMPDIGAFERFEKE